jgi:hypothetical protein
MAITPSFNLMDILTNAPGVGFYWKSITYKIFDSVTLAHGAHAHSDAFTVIGTNFSLHLVVESADADGTVAISRLVSNTGDIADAVAPIDLSGTDLSSLITATAVSKLVAIPVDPVTGLVQFTATNGGSTGSATFSLYLCVQTAPSN